MSTSNRVVIVGAGIVGSSLAKHLSLLSIPVTLLDRSLATPIPGSTGHAPGFVGQLNEFPTLTNLAIRSVADYKTIPNGFAQVGGLEVAYSTEGHDLLFYRQALAQEHGLPADIISAEEAVRLNPAFVKRGVTAALFYKSDGTAAAETIALHDRAVAQSKGAELVEGDVTDIIKENGLVTGVQTTNGFIAAGKVVVTTGIWARQLLPTAPVHPVAHPYSHSQPHEVRAPTPFVRWPENHVYGRDHGTYDGIGSYDHPAISVDAENIGPDAYAPWEASFDKVLEKSYAHTPAETSWEGAVPFNGLFSMTPDNFPLVGEVGEGVWCAVAVWVTTAGGAAALLAKTIAGEGLSEEETKMMSDMDPNRFDGKNQEDLKKASLHAYNNIYNTD